MNVKSSCGKIFTTVLKSLNNALPAAMVWIIITLLKGDAYACAFWPYKSDLEPSVQVCEKNETILLPCQIPVTTGKNDFTTCNEQLARNLRAESHMIAFVYIALAGFFAFFGYVLHQCNGPYSYYQKSWIDSYTTTEHDVMQHKIQLRLVYVFITLKLMFKKGQGFSERTSKWVLGAKTKQNWVGLYFTRSIAKNCPTRNVSRWW